MSVTLRMSRACAAVRRSGGVVYSADRIVCGKVVGERDFVFTIYEPYPYAMCLMRQIDRGRAGDRRQATGRRGQPGARRARARRGQGGGERGRSIYMDHETSGTSECVYE